jgi:uncharacterized protein (DUF1330 family)
MKTHAIVGLSMLAGVLLGVGAVETLHAAAAPPVYFIAENELTNPEAYAKEYLPLGQPTIKAGGGRYLAAGTATPFDGEPPKARVVILVWDSMDQLKAWFYSKAYQDARKIGDKYAKFRTFAIQGVAQ